MWTLQAPMYLNKVRFRSSFGGKKKLEKAKRRFTVFETFPTTPALLEAGCILLCVVLLDAMTKCI